MAKYQVTYSCGHAGTVQLFGKSNDRERRIQWYESAGLCPECYQAQLQQSREVASQRAHEWATIQGLPDLAGTPRQIAWAESIRYDRLTAAGDLAAKLIGCADEEDSERVTVALAWLGQQTEARWWIDNREVPVQAMMMGCPDWATLVAKHCPAIAEHEQKRLEQEAIAAAERAREKERSRKQQAKIEELRSMFALLFGSGAVKVWSNGAERRVYIEAGPRGETVIEYYHTGNRWNHPQTIVNRGGMKIIAEHARCDEAEAEVRLRDFCKKACADWKQVVIIARASDESSTSA